MKKNIVFIIVAFLVGGVIGWCLNANRDVFSWGDGPLCLDGEAPDKHGCCEGELYTDMGDLGFNCCPESGGDCFPPIR